jgi:hypothetical protein
VQLEQGDDLGGGPERVGDDRVRRGGVGGDELAVPLADQHVAGERAVRVELGEALEGGTVGAASGSDEDGWIEVRHLGSLVT